jgi:ferredoxin-fold anticodon binding domain-containing protein
MRIRLTEAQLHRVIKESIRTMLREEYNNLDNLIGKLVCVRYNNSAGADILGYLNGISDNELILKNAIDLDNDNEIYK